MCVSSQKVGSGLPSYCGYFEGKKKCGVTISRNLDKGTEKICSVTLRLVDFSLSETPEPFQLWGDHPFNFFTL